MPRPRKPARLWLEPERRNKAGRITHVATWIIRDADGKHRTGCGAADLLGAQRALADHIARQHAGAAHVPNKTADGTLIADVLAYYVKDAGDEIRRPQELLARLERLLSWWGDKCLGAVNRASCKAYERDRGSRSAARRELEDLRSAVNLYIADGLCREAVKVTLPTKHKARVAHFTRSQVALMVWHCWRTRETQTIHVGARKGETVLTDKRPLRHLVPFILTAVYTGTRSSRIWQASFEPEQGRPWVDLEGGVFHRLADGEEEMANKRAGTIAIPDRLLAHMQRWRRGGLLPNGRVRLGQEFLCEYRGRPADPKRALAGVMASVFGPGHGFVRHTFRHTCATWLMWAGEDINDVAAYMSMTREMVEKVYGHHHPDAHSAIGASFSTGKAGRRVGRNRRERNEAPRQFATETPGTNRDEGGTANDATRFATEVST
ncbi:MAG: integrase [Aurantimonas coralicida]